PGRQVGGGDGEAPLRQAEGLRADAARDIEDGSAPRPPAFVDDCGELSSLPLDTGIPVLKDQVVQTRHPIVELAHRRGPRPRNLRRPHGSGRLVSTHRGSSTSPKARTGKVPMPLTLTGTAKKRNPAPGSWAKPRRCSTMGTSAASRRE